MKRLGELFRISPKEAGALLKHLRSAWRYEELELQRGAEGNQLEGERGQRKRITRDPPRNTKIVTGPQREPILRR